jgi:hypothetical protein
MVGLAAAAERCRVRARAEDEAALGADALRAHKTGCAAAAGWIPPAKSARERRGNFRDRWAFEVGVSDDGHGKGGCLAGGAVARAGSGMRLRDLDLSRVPIWLGGLTSNVGRAAAGDLARESRS